MPEDGPPAAPGWATLPVGVYDFGSPTGHIQRINGHEPLSIGDQEYFQRMQDMVSLVETGEKGNVAERHYI